MRNSGFPPEYNTPELQQQFVDEMNEEMKFTHNIKLKVEDIVDDSTSKLFFKVKIELVVKVTRNHGCVTFLLLQLNACSFLGKVGQRNDRCEVMHIHNQVELDEVLIKRHYDIVSCLPISSRLLELRLRQKPHLTPPSLHSSSVLAAHITGFARCYMLG